MTKNFEVGVSSDFYTDAKGRFETVLEENLGGREGVTYRPMPPQPGKLATPEALNQFDGIFALAIRIPRESLQGVTRPAMVSRWGVGYDRIDVEALTEADILLSITPKAVRRPVAEAILTLIFALSKNLLEQDRMARRGGWRSDLARLASDVSGRVLGSVGCGNIAQELFRLARPLGFGRLLACDPFVKQAQVAELGVELVDLNTVLRESDFVTVNTPLNDETRGMIGERQLRMMKPTAFFINTARGGIVDHAALVRALSEDWIRGAGIDVYPVEPPPKNDPLFELENVIVAPHALAWTEDIWRNNGAEACRNMLAIARGELPDGIVNRQVIDRPGFQRKLERFRIGAAAG